MNHLVDGKGIKISPIYYQKDWHDLDLSRNDLVEWNKAIEIFKDRIDGRYLKQIEVLDKNLDRSIGKFSGFAIMSLTCLFIETIEQFWTGNIQTGKKNQTGKNRSCFFSFFSSKTQNISNDALTFHSFFQRNNTLKSFFDSEEKSDVFYRKIRCGLLHQGQTKGKSLIHIRKNEPILRWIDENKPDDGISIQRRLFVNEVTNVYKDYVKELQKPETLNFRRKFAKKMQYIVDQK